MQLNNIKVEKTARYAQLGELSKSTSTVWIVVHGYAQLAAGFIQEFLPLEDETTVVIAPEGLSRFYSKGFYGTVVATWMTKEDRLNEISDYCNYLQKVYEHAKAQVGEDVTFNLLGFSQGVQTITRWVNQRSPEYNNLLMWAGDVPADLDLEKFKQQSHDNDLHLVYGLEDPFITEPAAEGLRKRLNDWGIKYTLHTFEGAHEIDIDTLMDIAQVNQ